MQRCAAGNNLNSVKIFQSIFINRLLGIRVDG